MQKVIGFDFTVALLRNAPNQSLRYKGFCYLVGDFESGSRAVFIRG